MAMLKRVGQGLCGTVGGAHVAVAALVEYTKQCEADVLLPWTHKADTHNVFELHTPQQWKQEKEALKKHVISPHKPGLHPAA